jgi:hypothetical protein
MNTMTNQEDRTLTAEELDTIAGGLFACMYFGDFTLAVDANAHGYQVTANNGCSTYQITQY